MRLDFASFCSQQTACGFSPWTRCQILSQDQTKHEYCIPQAFTQLVSTYKHFPTFVLKSWVWWLILESAVWLEDASSTLLICSLITTFIGFTSWWPSSLVGSNFTVSIYFACSLVTSSEVPSASSVYLWLRNREWQPSSYSLCKCLLHNLSESVWICLNQDNLLENGHTTFSQQCLSLTEE